MISKDVGNLTVYNKGVHKITVNLFLDESNVTTSEDFQSFNAGLSVVPLLIILGFAVTTHMVEFSLFSGVFVGACMIEGSLKGGFTTALVDIILQALADEGHGFVYLFILFMNGRKFFCCSGMNSMCHGRGCPRSDCFPCALMVVQLLVCWNVVEG